MTRSALVANRARRVHGPSNIRKLVIIGSAIVSKTRCSVAGLLMMLQAVCAFAFGPTWPCCSTRVGPFGPGRPGAGKGTSRVFDTYSKGRRSGKSATCSPVWIARDDQQQQHSSYEASLLPVVGVDVGALRVRTCSEPEEAQAGGGSSFVDLFRDTTPYIRAHMDSTMVVHMGGEILDSNNFSSVCDDVQLLQLLGVSDARYHPPLDGWPIFRARILHSKNCASSNEGGDERSRRELSETVSSFGFGIVLVVGVTELQKR